MHNVLWLSNALKDEIQSHVKEDFDWIEKPFAKLDIGDDSFMVSDLGTRPITIYIFVYALAYSSLERSSRLYKPDLLM